MQMDLLEELRMDFGQLVLMVASVAAAVQSLAAVAAVAILVEQQDIMVLIFLPQVAEEEEYMLWVSWVRWRWATRLLRPSSLRHLRRSWCNCNSRGRLMEHKTSVLAST